MPKHEIHIDASTLRNEIQEKLKALKKFEASEEFTAIKDVYSKEIDVLEEEYEKELEKRNSKKKSHDIIYSDLDRYLLQKKYLESIVEKTTCKEYIDELN